MIDAPCPPVEPAVQFLWPQSGPFWAPFGCEAKTRPYLGLDGTKCDSAGTISRRILPLWVVFTPQSGPTVRPQPCAGPHQPLYMYGHWDIATVQRASAPLWRTCAQSDGTSSYPTPIPTSGHAHGPGAVPPAPNHQGRTCHKCGQPGHIAKDCREFGRPTEPSTLNVSDTKVCPGR